MAYLKQVTCFLFFVYSPLLAVAADFDYAAYKRSTIPEILERHRAIECQPTAPRESVLSGYAYKYRIITTFLPELRPIGEGTKAFLRRYGTAFRWNQDVVDAYTKELLVKDGGKDYWVPVQDPLLPAMSQELK